MTNPDYAHITILADRTGSMGEIADPGSHKTKADLATEGIHRLIREQSAQPGKTTFSLTQFDSQGTDRIAEFLPGDDPAITGWQILPRFSTPLLDATATEIIRTGELLAAMPEDQRPGRVYLVIGTDGEENCSREYTKRQVADMITRQREVYQWEIVFIGADIDAFAEAASMGITLDSAMQTSGAHTRKAYLSTNSAISRSRASGQSVSYTEEEREEAK